jgi:hypothetical protein
MAIACRPFLEPRRQERLGERHQGVGVMGSEAVDLRRAEVLGAAVVTEFARGRCPKSHDR